MHVANLQLVKLLYICVGPNTVAQKESYSRPIGIKISQVQLLPVFANFNFNVEKLSVSLMPVTYMA